MKVRSIGFTCVLLAIGALCASADENDNGRFRTKLTGFQEVSPILTEGHGTFNATLDSSGTSLSFTLKRISPDSAVIAMPTTKNVIECNITV